MINVIDSPATDIAHTIQLAVAPVFLLTGIGGLLGVLAGRLARVIDRSRVLETEFTHIDHPDHERQVEEFRVLDRRMKLANSSTFLCTLSAVLVCMLVAALFVAQLARLDLGAAISLGFILAMLLLIVGLGLFLAEVRLALQSIRVREVFLEQRDRRERAAGRK